MSRSAKGASLTVCASLLVWGLSTPVAVAQVDADQAFAEGSSAFEAGDDQLALQKMRAAYRARADYRTAAGLGQVELHLARYRDAAEHLEFSLRHYPADGDPEGRELVMRGFADARSHVATVTLVGQVEGAVFTVDGERAAALPVEHDLFVDAGTHRFSFSKPGWSGARHERYFAQGSQLTLRVDLRAPAQVGSTPKAELPVPREVDAGIAPVLLTTGGVLTLIGLGVGAGFHFGAEAAGADADHLRARLRQTGASCEAGDFEPGCRKLEDTLERSSNRQTISTLAFIGAAGTAFATLTAYTITVLANEPESSAREHSAALGWSPAVGPDFVWLGLGGPF